jgi:hypothetical protein
MKAKILLIFLVSHSFFLSAQTLSGKVYRGSSTPIQNAKIILTDVITNTVMSTLTDASGNYSFTAPLGATYTLSLKKDNSATIRDGISIADLVQIGVFINTIGGGSINTPYKMIAADVDDSGEIDASDQSQLHRFLGFVTPNLPSNGWVFVAADYVFPSLNPLTNYPRTKTITLTAAMTNIDFIGVKRGDVNYTASTTP